MGDYFPLINGRLFLRAWLGRAISGAMMAFVVYVLAIGLMTTLFGSILTTVTPPALDEIAAWLGISLAITLAGGLAAHLLAHVQVKLLQRHLLWTADEWARNSVLGGVFSGLLTSLTFLVYNHLQLRGYSEFASWLNMIASLHLFGFVGLMSLGQWLSLRQATRHAWLWPLANLSALAVCMGLLSGPLLIHSGLLGVLYALAVIGVALGALGIVTGQVLLYLFEQHSYPAVQQNSSDPFSAEAFRR